MAWCIIKHYVLHLQLYLLWYKVKIGHMIKRLKVGDNSQSHWQQDDHIDLIDFLKRGKWAIKMRFVHYLHIEHYRSMFWPQYCHKEVGWPLNHRCDVWNIFDWTLFHLCDCRIRDLCVKNKVISVPRWLSLSMCRATSGTSSFLPMCLSWYFFKIMVYFFRYAFHSNFWTSLPTFAKLGANVMPLK